MMDIEEKYDLMKRDLDKAVKEADKLDEMCCRLERENSDYHFENMKLEKQLAIAVKALETIERKSDKFDDSWGIQEQLDFIKAEAQSRLYQIEELDK